MIKQAKDRRSLVTVVVLANLIAACSGSAGPSEADMVAACMKEGESVIQKNRDKQMGVNRDTFCKCAAKEAKSALSADGQRAMILGMQGKKEEARAITSKMSESQQEAHLKNGIQVVSKCIEGPQ